MMPTNYTVPICHTVPIWMMSLIRQYMRKAPPGSEANDVLADVMVLLLQRKQRIPQDRNGFPTGPGAVFLCRYALATVARRHARRNARYRIRNAFACGLDVPDRSPSPEEVAAWNQLVERMARCVRLLPATDRELAHFRMVDSLPLRAAALRLKCSPASAMRRWHRTREQLIHSMQLDVVPVIHSRSSK